MDRPNIVFIFTDDQRHDTIHALGNDAISTPNMDRLVASGTAFTNAHIPSGTSAAVCMPSRAMLHTGRSLFNIDGLGERIPPVHTTMGEWFAAHGYRTIGIGKWHNGTESYARSFSDGGEIFFGGSGDHWNIPSCRFDPSGAYSSVVNFTPNAGASNEVRAIHCDHITPGRHSADLHSDCAVDFIEKYHDDTPFFLYLSFFAPHDPRTMPASFRDSYDPDSIALPANYREEHRFDFGVRTIRDEVLAPYPRTASEVRRHILEYYAMISHLDAGIGRVLDAIERSGLAENTIVVLAGDNGLAVGQHGLMGKQSLYEHSIRVPLLIAGPGVPVAASSDAFVYLFDLFPTLCDLVGIGSPDSIDGGLSFAHAVRTPGSEFRDRLYLAYTDLIRGIKTDRFKLIEYATPAGLRYTQLFDIIEDPAETVDLGHAPGYETTIMELRNELFALRDEWNDTSDIVGENGENFWRKYEHAR